MLNISVYLLHVKYTIRSVVHKSGRKLVCKIYDKNLQFTITNQTFGVLSLC